MLAYAASRPAPVERRSYPNAMLVIIAVHVAALAALMSAKMDLPIIRNAAIDIFNVPAPKDPPPAERTKTQTQPRADQVSVTQPQREVETNPVRQESVAPAGGAANPGPPAGEVAVNLPVYRPPVHPVVKLGPTLLTSGEELKPPYPSSKIITEEEASLTLRLTIDERGRVVAVEPVGKTDPVFLAAARRHLLANWRYRPASEDGRPMTSSAVITLRFQLDG